MPTKSLLLPLVLLVAVAVQPEPADRSKKELKRLQGTWTMAALEIDGKDVPADKIDGTTLTIKEDRYTVKVKANSNECALRLDPNQKPAAIDMIFTKPGGATETYAGIYELKDGTLRIARGITAEHKRPDQFMTWPDTGYFVVTWRRRE